MVAMESIIHRLVMQNVKEYKNILWDDALRFVIVIRPISIGFVVAMVELTLMCVLPCVMEFQF